MRICTIASGSSGNCIYVGDNNTHLLIDAGISGKRIEQGLNEIGLSCKDIDALFITHEHIDHVKSLGVLARRYGMKIFSSPKTYAVAQSDTRLGKIPDGLFTEIKADRDIEVGEITVKPFSTSHDAADPLGFRFDSGRRSFALATDLGTYDDYIIGKLQNLDGLLIESNHDIRMLEAGPYPFHLKQRILSDRGHLSNESAGRLLNHLLHDNMKNIILGHLSMENNYPQLAYQTVCSEITCGDCCYKAGDFNIETAHRDRPGNLIEY